MSPCVSLCGDATVTSIRPLFRLSGAPASDCLARTRSTDGVSQRTGSFSTDDASLSCRTKSSPRSNNRDSLLHRPHLHLCVHCRLVSPGSVSVYPLRRSRVNSPHLNPIAQRRCRNESGRTDVNLKRATRLTFSRSFIYCDPRDFSLRFRNNWPITRLYCLPTEAHVCEQLAQGCYLKAQGRYSKPRHIYAVHCRL